MRFRNPLIIVSLSMLLIALLSCRSGAKTLKRELLFTMNLGVMENEVDFFERDGTLFFDRKIDVAIRDGLFFVSDPSLAKVMKFSSYGDILALIYNERFNLPFKKQDPLYLVSTWDFQNINHISVDSDGMLYVDDRIEVDAESVSSLSSERVILKFNSNGEYQGFLGQEGPSGTPFPYILELETMQDDSLVVVTRKNDNWAVHIYEKNQELRYPPLSIPMTFNDLDQESGLTYQVNLIKPDRMGQYLFISAAGISQGETEVLPRMLVYDIQKQDVIDTFLFPLAKQGKEFTFLGADDKNQLYFVRDISKTGSQLAYELQVLDIQGTMIQSFLLTSDLKEPTISTAMNLAGDGTVYSLLTYRFGVDVVWWRHH